MPISSIPEYHATLTNADKAICDELQHQIKLALPDADSKVWHGHPVWFLARNPIVGYASLKDSVQLLFWSGQSFDEPGLVPEGKFKAAQIRYTSVEQIDKSNLQRWLQKSRDIQWDYEHIVKNRGQLVTRVPQT